MIYVQNDPIALKHQAPFDRYIAFVYSLEKMVRTVKEMIDQDTLDENGYLFLLYPKKRLHEMVRILNAGYKTKDLYR